MVQKKKAGVRARQLQEAIDVAEAAGVERARMKASAAPNLLKQNIDDLFADLGATG